MKKIAITFQVVLVLGLAMAACSSPPIEEMNRAQDAVTIAENDVNAVIYAGNTLVRAKDALDKMQSEADAKRYDEAKNYAAEAIMNAERAIADGRSGRERAREEAGNLFNSLSGAFAEIQSAINAAKGVPNLLLDFNAVEQDLALARRTYDDALLSLRNENYPDAIAKGQTVRSLLSSINTRINEAAVETNRKQ